MSATIRPLVTLPRFLSAAIDEGYEITVKRVNSATVKASAKPVYGILGLADKVGWGENAAEALANLDAELTKESPNEI